MAVTGPRDGLDVDVRRKTLTPAGRGAADRVVLENLRFSVGAGEIVALVGPSGCGKTTLLRLIGGLDRHYDGHIGWHGGVAPRIGTIFQEPRLLPWRTVRHNIDLVRPPDPDYTMRLIELLGLAAHVESFPPALSLGLARRVAIARALAIMPDVLLLDEPFVSLDPAMAEVGRDLLLQAWRQRPTTALLVTHDRAEAACLADRILLLTSGPARLAREVVVPVEARRQGYATGRRIAEALDRETFANL